MSLWISSCCLTSDSRPFSAWTRAWTCGSGVPLVFSVELISGVVSRVMSLSCTGARGGDAGARAVCERVADLEHPRSTSALLRAVRSAPRPRRLEVVERVGVRLRWRRLPSPIWSDSDEGSASRSVAAR